MTITLEIRPEIELELARQAAAHGLGVDAYAMSLLEEAATSSAEPMASTPPAKNVVELFAPIRGLNLDFERDRALGCIDISLQV